MAYLLGLVLPVAIQLLFIFIVIAMNTGNGSWVGLGVYLLGLLVVPATALANFFYIRARRQLPLFQLTTRCFMLAMIVPVLVVVLLLVG